MMIRTHSQPSQYSPFNTTRIPATSIDNLENNNIPSTNRTETTNKTNTIKNNENIDLLPVKNSSSLAILPILLALLPPLLAFFLGMEDLWSDLFLLILVIFYLYNLIQLPWDFYLAARKRRFINPIDLTMYNQNENLPADASSEALRYQAQYRLWWYEKISFLMVIISPILGGYIFLITRSQLTNLDTFVSDFNLLLFILAAEVRPMVHLGQLLTNSANELQQVVSHQTAALQSMQFRLQGLENQMDQLRQAFATKQDISKVKNQFEPPLNQLSQLVMRQYQKEKLEIKRFEQSITVIQRQIQQLQTELNLEDFDHENSSDDSGIEVASWLFQKDGPLLPELPIRITALPSFTLKLFILPITLSASLVHFISRHIIPNRTPALITQN